MQHLILILSSEHFLRCKETTWCNTSFNWKTEPKIRIHAADACPIRQRLYL